MLYVFYPLSLFVLIGSDGITRSGSRDDTFSRFWSGSGLGSEELTPIYVCTHVMELTDLRTMSRTHTS